MKTPVLIKLDSRDPDLSRIRELARASREGKIIAFPTETVYGIGAPMSVPGIDAKLAAMKGREPSKPFSFHIAGWEMVDTLKVERTPAFRYLSRLFWPGPVTLVCKNREGQTIGIRYPRNRLAVALIQAAGEPFVATSANRTGEPSPRSVDDVINQLGSEIDYVIDGGRVEIGKDSTIVDLTQEDPSIIRAGADSEAVQRAIDKIKTGQFPRKRILIVCTGNSCRSPMAAGWLQNELRRKGLENQIEVASCGVGARGGASATTEAILVMKNREVDISGHRSRPCTREDILDADMIFAMSMEHFMFITGLVPQIKDKIRILNVPDPIGLGMMVYEEVISNIERKMKEFWDQIVA